MTLHIFADRGLMLEETAGFDLNTAPDLRYTGYRQHKLPGASARVYQALHVFTRPLNLRISAHFAYRFNTRIDVERQQIDPALARVQPTDRVLWLNPSQALVAVIDALQGRCAGVSLYFLDPVHRLGLTPQRLRGWAQWAHLATYSMQEARRLDIEFLAPYVPALPKELPTLKELDVVYVGSPSPKRLLWVLCLRLQLWLRQGRGHLRLASRSQRLARWFPGTFSGRVAFNDYAVLCARSRGVLELHERDADGVTLRATLSAAVHAVHLCNLRTTDQTCVVSWWRWQAMDRFLLARGKMGDAARQAPVGLELGRWLRTSFLNA